MTCPRIFINIQQGRGCVVSPDSVGRGEAAVEVNCAHARKREEDGGAYQQYQKFSGFVLYFC